MDDHTKGKKRKQRSPSWASFTAQNTRHGGYDTHNIGGHTVNHGDGTSTTTDNRGSIMHYSDSGSASTYRPMPGGGNGRHDADTNEEDDSTTQAQHTAILAQERQAQLLLAQAHTLGMLGISAQPGNQPAPVLSVAGIGSIPLTDSLAPTLLDEFSRARESLLAFGTRVKNATPVGLAIAVLFHMEKLGVGSDKVPGRDRGPFLSLAIPARTIGLINQSELEQAAKTTGKVALPVRGKLFVKTKQIDLTLIKPQQAQVVPVVMASKDIASGLYQYPLFDGLQGVTTPTRNSALAGHPPLIASLPTVSINVSGQQPAPTGHSVTPYPVNHATRLHDIVVVYPKEAQLAPVYIMLEPLKEEMAEASRIYHPAPLTRDITAIKGLVRMQSVTPATTGEGLKARWLKGRDGTFYEWNSTRSTLEACHPAVQQPEQHVSEAGQHYHPSPNHASLTHYGSLQSVRAQTPLDGGQGKKPRWRDILGNNIYEWNPTTGQMEHYKAGYWETEFSRSGEPITVWVVESVIDAATGLYGITLPDKQGRTGRSVLISPLKGPGSDGLGHLIHPEERQIVILNTGVGAAIRSPLITVFPHPQLPDIDAQIAVPPLEVNYLPLYVMFNHPRRTRGVASGQGEEITGNWLTSAATEEGAPIPCQIAEKLRDRSFPSFDQFRRALWFEVSQDPGLNHQLKSANQRRVNQRKSPLTEETEIVGKRIYYEIHHRQWISRGGAVYNMDNMRILTPKRHIATHRKHKEK